MNSKILITIFIFNCSTIFAQDIISGILKNEDGLPIAGASIILTYKGNTEILDYSITKENGNFVIKVAKPLNKSGTYILKIGAMNYETKTLAIEKLVSDLEIILTRKPISLKEVILKTNPLSKKGDTLSYSVDSFKDAFDRSIADVIKKMPGITIEPSGRILFQGVPINKYYIEGIDLLGGKYALANENLSADDVLKVQILENHQPIKILDSMVFSDKAALNIKLKRESTFSGTAELGLGYRLGLYQANITPMLFNKKQQIIGSYQTNNRGLDILSQIRTYSMEEFSKDQEKFSNESWLSISSVQTPNFSTERWLDNSVKIGTWNHLIKLKNDLNLRINTTYFKNNQRRKGETNVKYFLPNFKSITLEENKNNFLSSNYFDLKATISNNSKKTFFENNLGFRTNRNDDLGILLTDGRIINQKLKNLNRNFFNEFNTIFKAGKQLFSFRSTVSFKELNEGLGISPGVFTKLINSNREYDSVQQEVNFQKFNSINEIEFSKKVKVFTLQSKIGLTFFTSKLATNLFVENTRPREDFFNESKWNSFDYYIKNTISYLRKNLKISVGIPIRGISLNYTTSLNSNPFKSIYIEPILSISTNLSDFWSNSTSQSWNNDISDLSEFHENFILYQYNQVQKNSNSLNQSKIYRGNTSFEYENPITARFFHLKYDFQLKQNTLIYSYNFYPDGSRILEAKEMDNNAKTHIISTALSQYFSVIGSTFEVSGKYQFLQNSILINENVLGVENNFLNMGLKTSYKPFPWFRLEYEYKYSTQTNRTENYSDVNIQKQIHQTSINLFPQENHFVKLFFDIHQYKTENHIPTMKFWDITYRYSVDKYNIDLELSAYNLLGEKYFYQNSYSSNYELNFRYDLNPTRVMLTTKFNF